jgi:hypothetical protein
MHAKTAERFLGSGQIKASGLLKTAGLKPLQ